MTNKEIANLFRTTASLMEVHDENPFKIRPYSNAAIVLDNRKNQVQELSNDQIQEIDGIGKGISSAIRELIETGTFSQLEKLIADTPDGIMEMVYTKGIGPKKIKTLWRDHHIENITDLLEACKQGRVAKMKGFGEKTQEKLIGILEYKNANKGKVFYSTAESIGEQIKIDIEDNFSKSRVSFVGDLRRKMEVIDKIELLVGADNFKVIHQYLNKYQNLEADELSCGPFTWRGAWNQGEVNVVIHLCMPGNFYSRLFFLTGSEDHLRLLNELGKQELLNRNFLNVNSEEEIYKSFELNHVPPELREGTNEIALADSGNLPTLIENTDLQGSFHNHSNYSDGKNTVREMAQKCMEMGFQYLGMADHSKSAFYASGLQEYQVLEQHKEIDALNEELAPFRIFKGIESDILNDGSLDYDEDVLDSFDFIVASIHSNLGMDKQKATGRLLAAIENPYTTFLGHPTGRLLLNREGYPIDHKTIIDACAKNNVIIEINANPWRLDLDWRWVHYAIEKGIMLSINPDAHEVDGLSDMYYGICVGRKGGLTKENTFNALDLKDVEKYLSNRKARIKQA
jgi:DNA polymerase (family 10)